MINSLLTQNNVQLLLRLLVAHLITDFPLRMDSLWGQHSKKKWFSSRLYVHGVIAGVLAYIFAGFWHVIWLPIVIMITHTLLDGLKLKVKHTILVFSLDQTGRLIIIVACWIFLTNADISQIVKPLVPIIFSIESWILILSYAVIIWPVGIVIGKMTDPLRKQIKEESCMG